MPPNADDMARLWDMLDAARAAVEFTQGIDLNDYLTDRKTRNAVERNLEILGEAARCLSQAARDAHPDVPWKSMIGLRNVLTHEYDEIRHEILWNVCKEDLLKLIQQLEAMGTDNLPKKGEY